MLGREYLELAREILPGGTEKHWRGATGRAYSALFLEGRDALTPWGFVPARGDSVHYFVRSRFSFPAHVELKKIGDVLEALHRLRNKADYDLSPLTVFRSVTAAQDAVDRSTNALDLLDAIEADSAHLTTAVNAIRAAFP